MPPKGQAKADKGQKKLLEKQKQKLIEDKTFGLKNKNKSKSVQKYIKSITSQVHGGKGNQINNEAKIAQSKEEKKKQMQQQALLASIFKGTENIKKVSIEDTKKFDPTTIKAEQKIDLYIDQRDQKMNNSGQLKNPLAVEPTIFSTDIICKFFLEAVEKKQYGWFWVCPQGGDTCKYRHCLPKGYILKDDTEYDEINADNEETIEEKIERERLELSGPGTPVTFDTFIKWKAKKDEEKKTEKDNKVAELKIRGKNFMSGKDLFVYDPSLFVDDEDAIEEDSYEREEDILSDYDEIKTEIEEQSCLDIDKNNIQDIQINESIFQNDVELPEDE
ncbi:uncharacterized protein CMU_005210 [Cryptosporidium muris RN66]|uniref:C3H1-type domain-containing protein n=1 Tax=Cryptosporidium muris (strain RN66) TaxID=441375 RepID=B6AHA3_CRYMR|nr:uncharacterized protein CMU_005210 [Cryptosporidium muris RN66]EEA07598.1 hypothetical protein, conserved [Cryptosporidium muris RN66]|eukprot:XP_002141947.1 hypothetical protein [Cryptosporidium muris RN66]